MDVQRRGTRQRHIHGHGNLPYSIVRKRGFETPVIGSPLGRGMALYQLVGGTFVEDWQNLVCHVNARCSIALVMQPRDLAVEPYDSGQFEKSCMQVRRHNFHKGNGCQMREQGVAGWEEFVPAEVVTMIKDRHLFGYTSQSEVTNQVVAGEVSDGKITVEKSL